MSVERTTPSLRVMYDAECGLCDAFIAALLKGGELANGEMLPLQSSAAKEILVKNDLNPTTFDTIVLVENFGQPNEIIYQKSDAALRILSRSNALWGTLLIVPRRLRDALYGVVSRHRHRIFKKRTFC